jgi:Mg-chelatase subunit ChlD
MKRLVRGLVAASVLSSAAYAEVPQAPQTTTVAQDVKAERPVLDVVFALDTTGSMGGLLEGAKQKIWSIASRMAAGTPTPRVRVGLVAYRDVGDAYVTQVYGLSEDLDTVYKNLSGFRADGGGDGPEAVQTALADAVDKMQWSDSKHAAKMIFLVGDAPAHDQDRARLNAASKKAIAKGIVVNTIRCGGDGTAEAQFREVARLADGRFDSIDQGGGVVATATPYDAELAKLNGAMMDTAIYAGRREAQVAGETRRAEAKAMAAPAAADRVGFMTKSKSDSFSGAGSVGAVDLAAAPEKAATLSTDELPAAMKPMAPAERVEFARKQQAQRQALEKQITELSKKRDEFINTKVAAKKDSFDNRVFESVKTSAAKAGVAY